MNEKEAQKDVELKIVWLVALYASRRDAGANTTDKAIENANAAVEGFKTKFYPIDDVL